MSCVLEEQAFLSDIPSAHCGDLQTSISSPPFFKDDDEDMVDDFD